ncbi:Diacetylchitobiose deacetylase [Metallosphaera sp. J1]|uniref:PIG-L deacetylase family protein n=1 Tax=Metallosphaera TaxID=41980 RepID=UPI001EDF701E|nr:PIG-L family deacetylase [Metallosphaera javensis (ex Hofmann et al. 2022)]MCG3109697.1 Diacetylchitobiose deacetylase [Metallosphaera javensis (ex Hofmann et al. 2022)]
MKVLVIAPHPDDETLCCGGSILRYVRRGDEVHVAVVTDGRYGAPREDLRGKNELVQLRKSELYRAVGRLGLKPGDVTFLGFEDAHVRLKAGEVEYALRDLMRAWNPSVVYSPLPHDGHPDHSEVGRIVMRLGVPARFYLIWLPRGTRKIELLQLRNWRRVRVDICKHRETKIGAINEYRSQLGGLGKILERLTGRFETFYVNASLHLT